MKDLKDMLKFVNKGKMTIVLLLCILYNASIYGISFALSYFVVAPITTSKLTSLLISLVVLYVLSAILNFLFNHYLESFTWETQYDAQNYFYNKLLKLDPKNLSEFHSAYIQNVMSMTSVTFVTILNQMLLSYLPLLLGLISFIYVALSKSIIVGIISLLIFVIAFIVRYKLYAKRGKTADKMYDAAGKYDATLVDFIQNIFTVIRLKANSFTNKILNDKKNLFIHYLQKDEDTKATHQTVFTMITNLVYIVVIISAIIMLKNGEEVLSYILFNFTILGTIIAKLESSSTSLNTFSDFKVNKAKLNEIIGEKQEKSVINKWNTIEIKNGIFRYKNRNTDIKIPYFNLKQGDKVCVMGESGQGKTTILNILSDFYDLNSGEILIDGKNIGNRKINTIYISQDVVLFNLSIRENLTLGKNISDKKILELFEEAGLMEWYNNLENGLDEVVGEKGMKLSAGQQQRLNIIRGILMDNDLYFLDEPTSNLDVESERKIIEMIDKYLKNKTYIIVTHRDAISKLCNKHYMLENHIMKEV